MRWSFDKIGQTLGESVDTTASPATQAATRKRILEAAAGLPGGSARRTGIVGLALAAGVAGALVFGVHVPRERTPVVFRVGESLTEGRIGAYYSAERGRSLALQFSDDSAVTLETEASARVSRTTTTGAQLSLESGSAEVHVVHRPDTSWQVAAGPYSVHVTGTSFRIEWQPRTHTMDIAMHEGSVRVTGPGIASAVQVRGTEHFTTGDATATGAEPVSPPTAPNAAEPGRTPTPSAASSASAHAEPEVPVAVRWSALAAKGRYGDIVQAAEKTGLDSVLASGDRAALSSLADAARFTGRADLCRRTLLVVRERFAGTASAADAAFVLGRMDDEAGAVSSGFAWYDRYLSESPSGHFAAEALGRKMLALRKLGDLAAAGRIARQYLQDFPDGPYASIARQLSTP